VVCTIDHHSDAQPITNGQGVVGKNPPVTPSSIVLVSTLASVQPADATGAVGPWAVPVETSDDDEAVQGAQAAEYLVRHFAERSDLVRSI
jgi:hypothetical protein